MLLNGKESSLYGAEYIGLERRISVRTEGSFSGGNYIDLGVTPAGGEGQIRFLMRGEDEDHCWEQFARLVQEVKEATIATDEGVNYDVVARGGEMLYVGMDRVKGGVFGIAEIPVLIASCYSDRRAPMGATSTVVGGAVRPYIRLAVTNGTTSPATITVNGFTSPFIVGPIPAGKTLVVDNKDRTVTIDGLNRISLFPGFEFPVLEPGTIASITTSPSALISTKIELWERWF